MKQIFKEFKAFLKEDAKSLDDFIKNNMVVYMEESEDKKEIKFFLENDKGVLYGNIEIEFLPTADTNYYASHLTSYGNCLGAYQVTWSEAYEKWGPFMYDLAMEYATMNGSGLTSDRAAVSEYAYKVWETYLKNRPDIERVQLDDLANSLTPDDADNCAHVSVNFHVKRGKHGFPRSPLSKIYRKTEPTLLTALKEKGKLVPQLSSDVMDL